MMKKKEEKKATKKEVIKISPRSKIDDTVDELIEDCHRKFDIEYGGYLANHTLHGLIALHGLDEPEDKIRKWYEEYIEHDYAGKKLEPAKPFDPSVQITFDNIDTFIGTKTNFQELCAFYEDELAAHTLEQMVLKYFPKLMKGVMGGAFHGVIHLGWAIYYQKSRTALAEGFAYLTYVNYPSNFVYSKELDWIEKNEEEKKTEEKKKQSVEKLFETYLKVRKDQRINEVIEGEYFASNGFQARLRKVLEEFDQIIYDEYSSKTTSFSIEELIVAISKLFYYSNSNNFFLLHLITALFGVFQILQFPFEKKSKNWVLWNFFHLSIMCYIAEGMPALIPRFRSFDFEELPLVLRNWDELLSAYLTNVPSRNEHILKVVLALKEFDKIVPNHSALFKHSAIDCMKGDKLISFSPSAPKQNHFSEIKYNIPSNRAQ